MKRFTALSIAALAASVSAGVQAAPPKSAAASPEAGAELVYAVTRDGSPIGRTTVDIDRSGDNVTVTSKTDIEVKVIIVLYRFQQDVTETWKGEKYKYADERYKPAGFADQVDENKIKADGGGLLLGSGTTLNAGKVAAMRPKK